MNVGNIITFVCSILFLSIGADKFFNFLEPPCSMMEFINPMIWKSLGVLQIVSGILIWFPKFKKYIVGFFAIFMFVFTAVHLIQGTSDIGGAAFMGVLLALLAWNPKFIQGKNS